MDVSLFVSGSATKRASGSTTGSTTRSSSSATRPARRVVSFAWKGGGQGRKPVPRRKGCARELAHLPRLAEADGVRAGSAVQALHGCRGAAAGGGADDDPGHPPRRGRDLLRPGAARLLRGAH